MARPLRLDHPHTFYHVLSRGNERKKIFRGEDDCARFIDTLRRMVERFGIEVHAFVLMGNHYHLLLRTKQANLSRAIQWLGGTYSVWFNRRHKRSGHLFQGRFKSFVIGDDRYFAAMCLYIHRNPLRAGLVKNLLDYPWSSFPCYMNRRKKVPWLTTSLILGMHDEDRRKFLEAHRQYGNDEKTLLNDLRYGFYLGGAEFVEKWRTVLREEAHREKPVVRNVLKRQSMEAAANEIFAGLGVEDPVPLLRPLRRERRTERDLAIYLLCHTGAFTHTKIAEYFGVGYTAITGTLHRARQILKEDKQLRKRVEKMLNGI